MSVFGLTPGQFDALEVARGLAAIGIPVFVHRPDRPPPRDWQRTVPDSSVVDCWAPGMMLAAVCGRGVDVLDVDPRNGGTLEAVADMMPEVYGVAQTKSGGHHLYIKSLGIRKSTLPPGIDVQAGDPNGAGRGYVYLPPSVGPSKSPENKGQILPYVWLRRPDLQRLGAVIRGEIADDSGAEVRDRIGSNQPKANTATGRAETTIYMGPSYDELSPDERRRIDALVEATVTGIEDDLDAAGDWAEGRTDDRSRGWERLCADAAWRLGMLGRATWNRLSIEEAEEAFVEHAPTGSTWTRADVERKWAEQSQRGEPAHYPMTASAKDAEGWAKFGIDVDQLTASSRTVSGAVSEGGNESVQAPVNGHSEGHDAYSLADAHLVETVVARALGGRVCWSSGFGWKRYAVGVWANVPDPDVVELVRRDLIAQYAREARGGADEDRLKALARTFTASRVKSIADLAKGLLSVDAAIFDTHPDLLCVGNGVVHLPTGELRPHDPAMLLTKTTKTKYVADATSPDWTAALTAMTPEIESWVQVRLGQAITGYPTPDDVLPVLHGGGGNGKSTITGASVAALGDHAVVVPEKLLLANPSDHSTELTTLRGVRMAMIEELPEGGRLNVRRLKSVMGTSVLSARQVFKDNTSWNATHSPLIATNYVPIVEQSDDGTWRRMCLVKFPVSYVKGPVDGRDPLVRLEVTGLRDRIIEGRDGVHEAVLAWLVIGARRWYSADRVLPPHPPAVIADTAAWRAEVDLIMAAFSDLLVVDTMAHIWSEDLHEGFGLFLRGRGHSVWSEPTLAARFEGHSIVQSARIQKRRTRAVAGLSRPLNQPQFKSVPAMYTAWFGVRFRVPADDQAESTQNAVTSPNAGSVQGVQGRFNLSMNPLHVEEVGTTLHKVHTPPGGAS